MTTPSRCTRRIEDNNNIIEIPSYHYSLHPSLPASITSGRFDEWRVTTRIKKYNIRIIVVRLWSLRSLRLSLRSRTTLLLSWGEPGWTEPGTVGNRQRDQPTEPVERLEWGTTGSSMRNSLSASVIPPVAPPLHYAPGDPRDKRLLEVKKEV